MKKSIHTIFFLLCFAGVFQVTADEITVKIDEASKLYSDSNYAEAANTLNAAAQLLNQKASVQLGEYLPNAPEEWEMSEPEYQNSTASLFGGGNAVSAGYSKGNERIEVSITSNPPALQSMLMMVKNPAFLGASGKKIEKYGGQKAIVQWNEESSRGSISVIVSGTALLSIEGNQTTLEMLKTFANAIEYKNLVALLMQ